MLFISNLGIFIFCDQKFLNSGLSISPRLVTLILGLNNNLNSTEIGSFKYGFDLEISILSSMSSSTTDEGLPGDSEDSTASVT